MNKKLSILIMTGFLVCTLPAFTWAEEPSQTGPDEHISGGRNPFQPWLPQVPVEVEDTKRPQAQPARPSAKPVERPTKVTLPIAKTDKQKPVELKPPDLRITGLVWNTNRPQAIINDKVVDIGDSVDEVRIIAINKTGVVISFQDQAITVTP